MVLSSLVRNAVGASKIALATVLILGIWYQEFLVPASRLDGVFNGSRSILSCEGKKPSIVKFIPSFVLLTFVLVYRGLSTTASYKQWI